MFKKAMVVIVIVTMLVSIMTSSFASGIEAYPKKRLSFGCSRFRFNRNSS